jgi:CheY-like chemotaxis protein/two-component sensor histidine kinase
MPLTLESVNLPGLIRDMASNVHPEAVKKQVTVTLTDPDAGPLFIWSDQRRIRQVLLNLLSNAIKYNKPGGYVTIGTELRPADSRGIIQVRISVSDSGIGISPEDIAKLFNPFERIGADKTAIEGTGLGLAVVKKLIEAMGGTVGVESEIGHGSTFWLEMPLAGEGISEKENIPGKPEPKGESAVRSGIVLYFEDNLPNTELVEQTLSTHRKGIRLISVTSGQQAVQLAIEHKPDLILLDLDLPDMHGSEVFRNLQSDPESKSFPVVIISADAMPQQVEELMLAGARDYLTKPLDINWFLEVLDEWI